MNLTGKPFTLPENAPDETFIKVYWRDIQREPRLLAGLRRPDGSLYLERRRKSAVFTSSIVITNLEPNDQRTA